MLHVARTVEVLMQHSTAILRGYATCAIVGSPRRYPAGVIFVLFGCHFWQSLAVGLFVSSLYSVLAGIFLAIVKKSEKLDVDLEKD